MTSARRRRWPQRAWVASAAIAAAIACGCVPQVIEQPQRGAAQERQASAASDLRPDGFPEGFYRQAIARGDAVFRVDGPSSLVTIEVRRAGSLSRLGHDHVVASHDLQGYVLPAANRADLYVRLDALVVDEPDLRKAAGFETEPSPEAIAGTRTNMLERTLDVQHYRFATIRVQAVDPISTVGTSNAVDVSIGLHGQDKTFRVPVEIDLDGDSIRVEGQLLFNQTDFAITPLTILGGAIAVQDSVTLHFRLRAQRLRALPAL